jgi:hypothetical protein
VRSPFVGTFKIAENSKSDRRSQKVGRLSSAYRLDRRTKVPGLGQVSEKDFNGFWSLGSHRSMLDITVLNLGDTVYRIR